mmetsp:Transcript_67385/g.179930  ORF Transcript_67385/g.179930 Transcript_67385/m.179930 type:complete len:219 (-) Transcript_67385:3127-3783(-)
MHFDPLIAIFMVDGTQLSRQHHVPRLVAIFRIVHNLANPARFDFTNSSRKLFDRDLRDKARQIRFQQSTESGICLQFDNHLPKPFTSPNQAMDGNANRIFGVGLFVVVVRFLGNFRRAAHTPINDILHLKECWFGNGEQVKTAHQHLRACQNRLAKWLVIIPKNFANHSKRIFQILHFHKCALERICHEFVCVATEHLGAFMHIDQVVELFEKTILLL